jgi:hypothetical protein
MIHSETKNAYHQKKLKTTTTQKRKTEKRAKNLSQKKS